MAARKFSVLSFPALRITLAVYVPAALGTLEPVAAFGVLFLVLPMLGYELAAHRICEWLGCSVRFRRFVMLGPVLLFAAFVFRESNAFCWGRRDALVRRALGGQLPASLGNVKVHDFTSMTGDWWMNASFQCAPEQMQALLADPVWTAAGEIPNPYHNSAPALGTALSRDFVALKNVFMYQRSNSAGVQCTLYTDLSHRLAYLNYLPHTSSGR